MCPKLNGPFASMEFKLRKLLKTLLKHNGGEITPIKYIKVLGVLGFFFIVYYSLSKRRKLEQ